MQVGGRLSLYFHNWLRVCNDAWVLEIVERGYCLEFMSSPPQGRVRTTPNSWDPTCPIQQETRVLLRKGAIAPVPREEREQGFYSIFFLRPKKTGGLRPILNLRPLNLHLRTTHFKMDNLGVIIQGLEQGMWAVSLDLQDAYLHISIRRGHQRYLRYALQDGKRYQFTTLVFGLGTAPRVFTKVAAGPGAYLRRLGFNLFQYLDDWLLVNNDKESLRDQTHTMLHLVSSLGFVVNFPKSDLVPSQKFTYLGTDFDLLSGRVGPSQDRLLRLEETIREVTRASTCKVEDMLAVLGVMASCIGIVPLAHLHMRPVQMYLLCFWRPSSRDLMKRIPIRDSLVLHLRWWQDVANLSPGVPLAQKPCQITLKTDASSSWGWGGYVTGGMSAQGTWSPAQKLYHINWLEMMAVWLCLQKLLRHVRQKSVLLRSDNMTVVSYVNKEGGTRSPSLCMLTWQVLLWCRDHTIQLRAVHIAGVDNLLADLLSRERVRPAEWSLHQAVVEQMFSLYGRPNIDLFASAENTHLPTFCSWTEDHRAWALDALSIPWEGMEAYAFPPISLLTRVLNKIRQSKCRVILVAPIWPRRPWYPRLLGLLRDLPWRLPLRPDLLSQKGGKLIHPEPEILQLAAWPLSNVGSETTAFHERLPSCSPQRFGNRHRQSTPEDLMNFFTGAIKGRWIPFKRA